MIPNFLEAILGQELLTGRELDNGERAMKVVVGVLNAVGMRQALSANGMVNVTSVEALSVIGKVAIVNGAADLTAYGVSWIGEELGLPMPVTVLLSLVLGITVDYELGCYVFRNGDGSILRRIKAKGSSNIPLHTQKNVEMPVLPEGTQWERNVRNSFEGGRTTPTIYEGGTVLYRIGGKNGGFWSLDPPPLTEYQWRVDYAIRQEFCNDASNLYIMTIPEGSSLAGLEGTVGTQGMGLYGGAHQVYIDYRAVPSDWIEIAPMNWR